MKKTLLTLALVLAAGGAQAVPLSDLLAGTATITAGDKLFDSWELLDYTSVEGRIFNAGNIDVTALNDGGMNPGPGLKFTASNGELSVTGDGIYNAIDLMFGFRVSVQQPGLLIKDNSLDMGLAVLSTGAPPMEDLGVTILEWVGDALVTDPATPGYISTEFSDLNGVLTSSLSASSNFQPKSEIWVTKNILVWATNAAETATLNDFSQRYSQTTVPEPSILALFGLGLLGLGFARRRA